MNVVYAQVDPSEAKRDADGRFLLLAVKLINFI